MAEHEYYEVNGRQIRVRPTESGQEIDEYGNFHRQPNHFTKGFGEGENPVEADRYILFWGKGCNWSNRASIARELLGLDKAIKVEIVDWGDYEKPLGWEFVNSPDHINKETGAQFLSELYYNADDDYEGRTTVPALVNYKEKKVVNNDYHHLTNHFETAFKPLSHCHLLHRYKALHSLRFLLLLLPSSFRRNFCCHFWKIRILRHIRLPILQVLQ